MDEKCAETKRKKKNQIGIVFLLSSDEIGRVRVAFTSSRCVGICCRRCTLLSGWGLRRRHSNPSCSRSSSCWCSRSRRDTGVCTVCGPLCWSALWALRIRVRRGQHCRRRSTGRGRPGWALLWAGAFPWQPGWWSSSGAEIGRRKLKS